MPSSKACLITPIAVISFEQSRRWFGSAKLMKLWKASFPLPVCLVTLHDKSGFTVSRFRRIDLSNDLSLPPG